MRKITRILLILPLLFALAQKNPRFELLDFQSASLQAIFQFLSETGDVNIVVDPNVEGTVTMRLKDITWQQVLTIILETYDLISVPTENTLRIMYRADYYKDEVSKRQFAEQTRELVDLTMKVIKINYATADEIAKSLAEVLSKRGKVIVDDRTNSLIITDIPDVFPKLTALIDELDKPTRQIKISAKIMLVDSDFLDEFGVQWQGRKVTEHPGGEVTVDVLTDRVADKLARFTYGIIAGEYDLSAAVAAIISEGKGRIIDRPEIITLDNKSATIYSGERIPVTTLDEAGNVITVMYETGTKLEVTPHITAEDRILMNLKPERSAYNPTPGGYTIITRNAKTNLIVADRETIVIGGLVTQETKWEESGVPVLKDIPLIGALFRYKRESIANKELIIMVTPEILPE